MDKEGVVAYSAIMSPIATCCISVSTACAYVGIRSTAANTCMSSSSVMEVGSDESLEDHAVERELGRPKSAVSVSPGGFIFLALSSTDIHP